MTVESRESERFGAVRRHDGEMLYLHRVSGVRIQRSDDSVFPREIGDALHSRAVEQTFVVVFKDHGVDPVSADQLRELFFHLFRDGL